MRREGYEVRSDTLRSCHHSSVACRRPDCLAVGRTVSLLIQARPCRRLNTRVDFIWTIVLLQEYVPREVDIPFTNYRQRLDLTFKAAVQTVNAHLNQSHTFPKFLFPPFSCLVFSCLAFSLPVFSCHAVWCRIFSRPVSSGEVRACF